MKTLPLSKKKQPSFSDYCQFLLASVDNFTQTSFADHTDQWSHDQLNRLLGEERLSAGDLWRSVKNDIEFDPDGYLLFDDTVVSKPYAKAIEAICKVYYAPLKRNRLVSRSAASDYQRVETLTWTSAEANAGYLVHIKKFPKGHQVKVFRLASASGRTEYIATNDLSQSDAEATLRKSRLRWKIEQLHRELKQTTGIGACQCRKHRAQRNHIACCLWVWVSLTRAARAAGQTIYQLKESLLDEDIRQQLQKPTILVNIA